MNFRFHKHKHNKNQFKLYKNGGYFIKNIDTSFTTYSHEQIIISFYKTLSLYIFGYGVNIDFDYTTIELPISKVINNSRIDCDVSERYINV